MTKLIPTPIVNKNGVSTTVHKRTGVIMPSLKSLESLKPTLGGTKPKSRKIVGDPFLDRSVTVKAGGDLPRNGIIMSNPDMFESEMIRRGFNLYAWRRSDMEMTNRELYSYLRFGVDAVEAVALKGIGVSPEDLPNDETLSQSLPGSISRITRGRRETIIQNVQAVEAMEAAKVPALKAVKALESGLQDGHLNGRFDIKQLVDLFSKYKYGVAIGDHQKVESSAVIDSVLSGDIPIEMTKNHTRMLLSRMEHEFNQGGASRTHIEHVRDAVTPEEFIRIASVGIRRTHTKQPVFDTYRLMQEHGDEVLDLMRPAMVELERNNGEPYGLRGAQFLHTITELTDGDTDIDVNDRYGDWQWDTQGETDRITNRKKVTMVGDDLLKLMDAGISADDAYNLMYKKGMGLEQILVAVESGSPMALAEGAL